MSVFEQVGGRVNRIKKDAPPVCRTQSCKLPCRSLADCSVRQVARQAEAKVLKILHFCQYPCFARFPSDRVVAEPVSAELRTEQVGGRAELKSELQKLFPVQRGSCKTSAA